MGSDPIITSTTELFSLGVFIKGITSSRGQMVV